MKNTLLALVAVLSLIGFSSANAQTAPAATTAAPAAKTSAVKPTRFGGVLTAVDATSITITDKTKAPRTIAITPTTKLTKDKKPAAITDFAIGDKVGGSYTTDASGALTATTLSTSTAKAKAKTTAAAATAPATTATH